MSFADALRTHEEQTERRRHRIFLDEFFCNQFCYFDRTIAQSVSPPARLVVGNLTALGDIGLARFCGHINGTIKILHQHAQATCMIAMLVCDQNAIESVWIFTKLVHAPREATAAFATWQADLWLEERVTLRAFRSLLGVRRFFGVPEAETLVAGIVPGVGRVEIDGHAEGVDARQVVAQERHAETTAPVARVRAEHAQIVMRRVTRVQAV